MASTPEPLTEIDAVLNKISLELVVLARTMEAGQAFQLVMNAAYQVERARSVLLTERAADGKTPFADKEPEKATAQDPGLSPSLPERRNAVATTLQQVEQHLTDFIAEIERAAPMSERNISVYLAAENTIKALAHLRQMLADA
jgi:hypothetical protein